MKWHLMFAFDKFAACGLLLGLGLMSVGPARAQNLLYNPGFELPIATNSSVTTNWFVKYVNGGPDDFFIRDRTTFAHHSGNFGGHFRPITEGPMHAYLTQFAVNLVPGANYVVSGWVTTTWSGGTTAGKMNVYIGTIGGRNSGAEVSTPICTSESPSWTFFSVTNTAKANTTLEVRLHYDKPNDTDITDNKGVDICSGCFDDISVTRQ
jgi:hypothetical protein